MLYRYKAINDENQIKYGYVEARSKKEALLTLKNEGFILIYSIKETFNIPILSKPREIISSQVEKIENKQVMKLRSKSKEKNKRKKFSFLEVLSRKKDNNESQAKIEPEHVDIKGIFSDDFLLDNEDVSNNIFIVSKDKSEARNYEQADNSFENPDDPFQEIEGIDREIDWDLVDPKDLQKNKKIKRRQIKDKDIIMFTKRMKIMLQAGISIPRALEILSLTPNKNMKEMIEGIIELIQEGESFSSALSHYPNEFDKTYVSLVSIGEESGNLVEVLDDISKKIEQEYKVKRKVKTASLYPAGVLIVVAIILFLGSQYMIPQFQEMFEELAADSGVELPIITQIVFGLAENMPVIIISIIAFIFIFNLLRRLIAPIDRFYIEKRDKIKLRLPKLKEVFISSYMYSISSNLSLMINSGIALKESISLTIDTVNNIYIKNELAITLRLIEEEAYPLSRALANQPNMDELLTAMALTGEESGEMGVVMEYAAEYFDQELSDKIADLMEIIQPVSILIIAMIVVPVVFAIFIPLLTMQSAMAI